MNGVIQAGLAILGWSLGLGAVMIFGVWYFLAPLVDRYAEHEPESFADDKIIPESIRAEFFRRIFVFPCFFIIGAGALLGGYGIVSDLPALWASASVGGLLVACAFGWVKVVGSADQIAQEFGTIRKRR